MEEQNYANHVRYVPLFHFVTTGLILATFVAAIVMIFRAVQQGAGIVASIDFLIISLILASLFFYCRQFALKAQDRAIRAEENLRHFALSGKLLDSRLRMGQITALRFASDEEFLGIAEKAASENMTSRDIKQSIKKWRPDHHRA